MGMDCEKFREMLDNYSDLSPQELDTLEAHALVCGECKRELEFMRSIINTVQSLPEIDPPADFLDKINERIDKEERLPVRICRKAVPYVKIRSTCSMSGNRYSNRNKRTNACVKNA